MATTMPITTESPIPTPAPQSSAQAPVVPTLCDLLEDGIYLLFLLRDGNAPAGKGEFNRQIDHFLDNYEKMSLNFSKPRDLIGHSQYALCALLDEIMLASDFSLRDEWTRTPLQLRLFGDHLAGEIFFDRLRALRAEPEKNIEALEVFHTCLLLGFQGKYLLDGQEKLDYLVRQLGQDIRRIRGEKTDFAPNWKLPHRFQNFMRHEMPMWFYFGLMALIGTGFFGVYSWMLNNGYALVFGAQ